MVDLAKSSMNLIIYYRKISTYLMCFVFKLIIITFMWSFICKNISPFFLSSYLRLGVGGGGRGLIAHMGDMLGSRLDIFVLPLGCNLT